MTLTQNEKIYLKIAMPAALEGIFMILLCNVDLIMVGFLGTSAIAAVSIFTQPRMIILCFARSAASAVTLIAAKFFGMNQKKSATEILKQTLFLGAIILAIIHAGFFIFLEKILLWMGAESEYLNLALVYGKIALISVYFTSLTAILQAVMIGFGNTKAVLITNVQGNILNIILSAILIFGMDFGVDGAAIGTVGGTFYTLIYTVIILRRDKIFSEGNFLPTKKYFAEFLPIFGSIFSEQGFERFGMVLYTRMVAELGTIPYAVHAICMNFCDFYYSFGGGLGKSSMVLAGQSVGRKNFDDWKNFFNVGIKFGLVFSAVNFILTFAFKEEILSLYSGDAEIFALGNLIMFLVAAVSLPEAYAMICAGILRGSGKSKQVAIYSLISVAILRPIITYIFISVLQLGLFGAWIVLVIDQSLRAKIGWELVNSLAKAEENFSGEFSFSENQSA